MRTNEDNGRRRGATAVEVALLLPIMFLLTLGVVEFGNAFYSWLTVQKAAQYGARFAATGKGVEDGSRLARIITETERRLATLNNGNVEISVRSWPDTKAVGDGIDNNPGGPCQLAEVSVLYQYKPIAPLVADMLPETITLFGYDRKVNEPWKPCDN